MYFHSNFFNKLLYYDNITYFRSQAVKACIRHYSLVEGKKKTS